MIRTHRARCNRSSLAIVLMLAFSSLPMASGCGDDDDSDSGTGGVRSGTGGSAAAGAVDAGVGGTNTAGDRNTSGGGQNTNAGVGGEGAAAGDSAGAGGQHTDALEVEGDRRIPYTPANDRAFVHFLIEHHQMAVHMADLVAENGANADVRQLAETMSAVQTQEIELLQSMADELQIQLEPPDMPEDPHHAADMSAMMSLSGAELDRMFLIDMIAHHAGLLPVAHRAPDTLTRDDLKTLADDMFHHQAAEIGEMKALLDELNVDTAGEDLAADDPGRADFGLVGDRRIPLTPSDDVTFVDFFIPNHQAAVKIATHLVQHGENAELRSLVSAMRTDLLEQIETMQMIRGELTGNPNAKPVPLEPHAQIGMARLMSLTGTELDLIFIEEMLPHHGGDLPVAHRAKPHLETEALKTLADRIYQAEAEQIGRMEALRQEIAGEDE